MNNGMIGNKTMKSSAEGIAERSAKNRESNERSRLITILGTLGLTFGLVIQAGCTRSADVSKPEGKLVVSVAETAKAENEVQVQDEGERIATVDSDENALATVESAPYQILSVYEVSNRDSRNQVGSESLLNSKKYVAILDQDGFTSGRSVLVFGYKDGKPYGRSFHFNQDGFNGFSYDRFYRLEVKAIRDQRVDDVAFESHSGLVPASLFVKGRSRLRGVSKSGQVFDEANYGLVYNKVTSAESAAQIEAVARTVLNRVYGRFQRLSTDKGPKFLSELKDRFSMLERSCGDGSVKGRLDSLPLEKYPGQTGAQWRFTLVDNFLKTDSATGKKAAVENVNAWINDAYPDSNIVPANTSQDDLIAKAKWKLLGRGPHAEAQFATINEKVSYFQSTNAAHAYFLAGAESFIQYEIVNTHIRKSTNSLVDQSPEVSQEVSQEVSKNGWVMTRDVSWILRDGSVFTYLPMME